MGYFQIRENLAGMSLEFSLVCSSVLNPKLFFIALAFWFRSHQRDDMFWMGKASLPSQPAHKV